ncbi:MAG: dihydrolipoamide acetyltransferase family protein [Sedimentibacter sp.]
MKLLKLPALGMGTRNGTIVKWNKFEGELVKDKEPLYEMESDKSSMTVEAPHDLIIRKIIHEEGKFEVGTAIAIISLPEEEFDQKEFDSLLDEVTKLGKSAELSQASNKNNPQNMPSAQTTAGGKAKATPVARKLAADLGVELSDVTGSGPGGLITDKDIKTFADNIKSVGDYEVINLSGFVKVSARHLTEGWKNVPHIVQHLEFDATSLINARNKLKEEMKVTYTDILVKLVPIVLKKHSRLNATMENEDEIKIWKNVNMSVAIETDRGLTVPVVKNADQIVIGEVHKTIATLAEKSKLNKLTPDDMSNGTFTISNLGAYGTYIGNPIINSPQVALLYVGAIRERPWIKNGKIEIVPIISMSLACDHRAIDGAVAARFSMDLREVIENAGQHLL